MQHRKPRSMKLHRETLRRLGADDLSRIGGADFEQTGDTCIGIGLGGGSNGPVTCACPVNTQGPECHGSGHTCQRFTCVVCR
jgi:hypothetical protein